MISSLAGDQIGSPYEFNKNHKALGLFTDASRFTDDTILAVATMDAILSNKNPDSQSYSDSYFKYAQRYPKHGYGKRFAQQIAQGKLQPYNSYGNGSAMRVSPIAFAFHDISTILTQAKLSAECTHSHPEGIRGAQAVAYLVWLCRNSMHKLAIKKAMADLFGDTYKKETKDFEKGKFDITCQGTVPLCAAIFCETNNFEEAMWKAIDMGGDVDTNCCIIGAFCDAQYGFPSEAIIKEVYLRLSRDMAGTVTDFIHKYVNPAFVAPRIADIDNSILSLDISDILA